MKVRVGIRIRKPDGTVVPSGGVGDFSAAELADYAERIPGFDQLFKPIKRPMAKKRAETATAAKTAPAGAESD